MIMGLGGLHAARGLGGPPHTLATPVQASGLPSNLPGVWLFNDQSTDGSILHIQRMVVTINSDTSGRVDFATQQSEIGGNGCTETDTGIFPGGNWFVNGQALSLTVPQSTFTFVNSCNPGMNRSSTGSGLFTFRTFVVNGDMAVATPPSDLNIHALNVPGQPVASSIILHRIAGPSGPTTSSTSSLLASVLPSSRRVQVGKVATAFATIDNTGTSVATGCTIALGTNIPATLTFARTDPNTNKVIGGLNTPVDIPAGGSASFVIAIAPTAQITPTDVALVFTGTSTTPAPSHSGLNTILFSAATGLVTDMVALVATSPNDGILRIPGPNGSAALACAMVNLGVSSSITATANTGSQSLPLIINLCQTNPQSGQCISATGPSVTFTVNTNDTPTIALFAQATDHIATDLTNNRINIVLKDSNGIQCGATSVAVTTEL
jgi:hypothetical protein